MFFDGLRLQSLIKKGKSLFYDGRYGAAIKEFTKAININRDDAELFYWRGKAEYKDNQYYDAIRDFNVAIMLSPKNDEYYAERAMAYFMQEEYEKAFEDIKSAINLYASDESYFMTAGNIQKQLNDEIGALESYKTALSMTKNLTAINFLKPEIKRLEEKLKDENARKADGFFIKGNEFFDNGNYEDAVECFQKSISLNSDNAEYHFWCGSAKSLNNQKEDAIKDFDKAIEINPQDPDYYFRGLAKYYIGKYSEAIEDYKIGINKQPEDLYNYYELIADAKKGLGDISGAIEVYKYILENESNEENKIEIQEKITELEQLRSQNNDVSQEGFEESEQEIEDEDQYEKSAEDYYEEGQTYLDEKKYEDAIKCFEAAINLDPNDADNYYWCGRAKHYNGQNKEALKDLTAGIKLIPEDICYYYSLRGDINKSLAKYNAAKKNYLKAINEALEDFDIDNEEEKITEIDEILSKEFYEKGKKYFDKNKYEKAIELFEKAEELAPNDDNYLYWCGYAKYWNNQEEEAIKDFDNAIEMNPIPKYYYFRGHSKYFLEKYKEAIEDYKIGISKQPEDLYNYYELIADAKKELGNINEAINNYQFALENNPDENECENIRKNIEELKNNKKEEEKVKIQETTVETEISQKENNIEPQILEEFRPEIAVEDQSVDLCIDIKNTSSKKEFVETENQKIKEAEFYYQKGKKQYESQKTLGAKNCFAQAINYNNCNPEYYYWFAKSSFKLNHHWDKPLEHIQKAIDLDNTKPEYYELRGLIYDKRGAKEESKRDYEYAEELKKVNYKVCEQEDIFKADKNESFLVNAGPGTGKTYTLIQKINYLLKPKNNIKEENILVLSHTNAAVNEIKERLKNISEDPNIKVHKINIRTICSFVKFALSQYYEIKNVAKPFVYQATDTGFTKANEKLIEKLTSDITYNFGTLLQDLNIKYFIVDEIQDATDSVGRIILELVKACIKSDIPVALFGDKCQAIFDFDKDTNEKYRLKSTEFYEKIEKLLKNRENVEFVELEKNMRQQDGLDYLKEDIADYRKKILENNDKECDECIQKIKKATPDNLDTKNINHTKDSTHCIITHSNDRALYIASKVQKQGIQVYTKITDNKIQFEYHEWIGKVYNNEWDDEDGDISCEDFEKFVSHNTVNLPTNYEGYNEGYDKENHARSFFEYLNTEILGKSPNSYISLDNLVNKLYYEYKCDNIFKCKYENKDGVEVSTIHKAKGREFDFVHIDSGCCDGDYFKDKYKSMYVALTRPKYFLDFVNFEMADFVSSKGAVDRLNKSIKSNKKIELAYIARNKKLIQYKVLYNDIDLESYKKHQKIINSIQRNEEIILSLENNSWLITYNNQQIGQMASAFVKNFEKNTTKYGKIKRITGLYVDGVWSVFDKNEDTGEIKVWNVVSFCGFGDIKYE